MNDARLSAMEVEVERLHIAVRQLERRAEAAELERNDLRELVVSLHRLIEQLQAGGADGH